MSTHYMVRCHIQCSLVICDHKFTDPLLLPTRTVPGSQFTLGIPLSSVAPLRLGISTESTFTVALVALSINGRAFILLRPSSDLVAHIHCRSHDLV